MLWSDPIVEEVRRERDAYAAHFNYDLRAIYLDLKQREKCGGRPIVSPAADDPRAELNHLRQQPGASNDNSANTTPPPYEPVSERGR
jgi:hypothetical protein